MSRDGMLIERFVGQALDDYTRALLKNAFDKRMCSENVLLRTFEFNCFDVSLDFEKGIVTVQDVLSTGARSFVDIPMDDFIAACGLSLANPTPKV